MVNIIDLIYESFVRYFNNLSKLGYKSYTDVNKIIVLLFMLELLDNKNEFYLTEDDFRIISRIVTCITGSTCLIDIPFYNTEDSLVHDKIGASLLRLTENDINRITLNNVSRIER